MSSKPQPKAKVLIIGGGIIGAALFYELCCLYNGDVILLEKYRFARGATGWSAGIVRSCHSDDELVRRGHESLIYYKDFIRRHPSLSFTQTGMLYIDTLENIEKRWDTATRWKQKGMLSSDIQAYSSQINWRDKDRALFEPECGYLDPSAVTKALIDAGRALGGYALEGVSAFSPIVNDHHIRGVETTIGPCLSSHVLLCTGAWSKTISKQWRLDLPLKTKTIQMNSYHVPPSSPQQPIFIDNVYSLYGRGHGSDKIYIGTPVYQSCDDPDRSEPLDLLHAKTTLDIAKRRFVWASDAVWDGGFRAFDAYSENECGIVQAHASLRGLFIATGFSGGGFKQAPAVAKMTVDLINRS